MAMWNVPRSACLPRSGSGGATRMPVQGIEGDPLVDEDLIDVMARIKLLGLFQPAAVR